MKYYVSLLALLVLNWLCWSGHLNNPFLLSLGLASCLLTVYMSRRMMIVDEEGAPAQLGLRPFLYIPWLTKEVLKSNLEVARIVLSPAIRLHLYRRQLTVKANQKSELGRVILANSITLTPGTVSVQVQGDQITVHALSYDGPEECVADEMNRRICEMEGGG